MSFAPHERVALTSSLLASLRYSPQATLQVEFRSGAIYRYFTVPRAVVEGLRTADSAGAYFNRHLRNRFPCQRLL